MIRKYLAKHQDMVYTCGIGAIALVGFDSLFVLVRIVTHNLGGFFYARSFSSLFYGGLFGGTSVRCFQDYSLSTPSNLPPVFDSPDGRNLVLGASL